MAIAKPEQVRHAWDTPLWPESVPIADHPRMVYGGFVDELAVLFEGDRGRDGFFDFIATPGDVDYAAIKVDMNSGAVIGVMAYPVAARAVGRHPAWREAMASDPPPETARRIVLDIKELYDRYGRTPEAPS